MSNVKQSVFDKATSAILLQGVKCSSGFAGGSCYYRHPNKEGFKCAIGHLISDEQMAKYGVVEGGTPTDFSDSLVAEILPEMDSFDGRQFLDQLQSVHDDSNHNEFCKNFTERANQFAFQWGLDPIKPKTP